MNELLTKINHVPLTWNNLYVIRKYINFLVSRLLLLGNVISAELVERIDDGFWARKSMTENSKLDLSQEVRKRSGSRLLC